MRKTGGPWNKIKTLWMYAEEKIITTQKNMALLDAKVFAYTSHYHAWKTELADGP